jgi:hypothetical protein
MLFEVARGDGVAAAVDDVFEPAGDLPVTVGVPTKQVTSSSKTSRSATTAQARRFSTRAG